MPYTSCKKCWTLLLAMERNCALKRNRVQKRCPLNGLYTSTVAFQIVWNWLHSIFFVVCSSCMLFSFVLLYSLVNYKNERRNLILLWRCSTYFPLFVYFKEVNFSRFRSLSLSYFFFVCVVVRPNLLYEPSKDKRVECKWNVFACILLYVLYKQLIYELAVCRCLLFKVFAWMTMLMLLTKTTLDEKNTLDFFKLHSLYFFCYLHSSNVLSSHEMSFICMIFFSSLLTGNVLEKKKQNYSSTVSWNRLRNDVFVEFLLNLIQSSFSLFHKIKD